MKRKTSPRPHPRKKPAARATPPAIVEHAIEHPPIRLVYAEAGSLTPNPLNWRTHPEGQVRALKAAIGRVGWIQPVLFNERTGRLIDGHARRDSVPPETVIPVAVVSLDEEAEAVALATLDPLSSMAGADGDALQQLRDLAGLDAIEGLGDLNAMLDELASGGAGESSAAEGERGGEPREVSAGASDAYTVLALCADEAEQERVVALLETAGVKCRINTAF